MTAMQQFYHFDSKRDAAAQKNVGAKVWDAEITDHSTPESLLIVVSTGKVEYNASGPWYWGKEVTYRRAERAEWLPVRIAELEKQIANIRDLINMYRGTPSEMTQRANLVPVQAEIDALKAERV